MSGGGSIVRALMVRGMVLLLVSSVLILAMLTPLEPIDLLYFELSSALNVAPEVLLMVSDILLLLAGFLIAASLRTFLYAGRRLSDKLENASSFLGRVNRVVNRKGLPSLIIAGVVIVFWHVPSVLDAALLQYELHWVMHVSVFFAGVLIYVGFTRLTLGMKLLTYLLGCKAMLILGAYMLVSPIAIYGTYPYPEQLEAGAAMVVMCLASDVTIIPLWVRRYFSKN
ncbi:MAG TPA: cytochrome c oxidase assembly protein [Candidatus Acidoferrales bacterium]|nr:cytochrome c oxidase assembly protein [Candidatus Acidoferrales bacterium]